MNKYSEDGIIKMLEFLVDNIYVVFAGKVFQQTVGIPMGKNWADIFLYLYEAELYSRCSQWERNSISVQSHVHVNRWCIVFEKYLGQMFPVELEINGTSESITSVSYLDKYNCQSGGMVNFTLRFTTNEIISISTSQTFRSL